MTGTDGQGFVGHTTRCDAGSSLVTAIETSQSMAVVCETAPGRYQYRGERLRDGANIQLDNAVPAGGGFDATNPADGAHYEVRPDRLRILSNGGVDSDEPALQYGSR
jgi:serine/threonine-protein kinase